MKINNENEKYIYNISCFHTNVYKKLLHINLHILFIIYLMTIS